VDEISDGLAAAEAFSSLTEAQIVVDLRFCWDFVNKKG
jgi:hypothetical protein